MPVASKWRRTETEMTLSFRPSEMPATPTESRLFMTRRSATLKRQHKPSREARATSSSGETSRTETSLPWGSPFSSSSLIATLPPLFTRAKSEASFRRMVPKSVTKISDSFSIAARSSGSATIA